MRLSTVIKASTAIAIVSVYIFVPGYRYYALGSYIGYKIMKDKPRNPLRIKRGTKAFNRFMGVS